MISLASLRSDEWTTWPERVDDFIGLRSWNPLTDEFTNVENLRMFYSWFFSESGKDAKIARGDELRDLAKVIADKDALEEFKKPGVSLAQALSMTDEMRQYDWERPLKRAVDALDQIPVGALEAFTVEQKQLLAELISVSQKRLRTVALLQQEGNADA